ncbi:MAG TPA: hypothetical protein VMI31_10615, partial [Fimbriimonadaceae bacterium]|nr:hypothetical protein [Fimbriimonadaceae bacterium]
MISFLAAALALSQGQEVVQPIQVPDNPGLTIQEVVTQLDPPKIAPKLFKGDQHWPFPWLTRGYGTMGEENVGHLRVRVYSQERLEKNDLGPRVTRMAMQIWDRCYKRLKLDSPERFNSGIVDYYLCFDGVPGGEQETQSDEVPDPTAPGGSRQITANSIYIYQLKTFKDPVEMAREVAHEYGHAVLPDIGGFKEPEEWANGYLGEKLFLTWFKTDMAAGRLTPDDAMGASLQGISDWVAKNVDPLVQQAAYQFPAPTNINEAKGGMDAFLGLAMYVDEMCPSAVFLRSLTYTQDAHKGGAVTPPTDYADNVVLAASEVEDLTLAVPKSVFDSKKPIWIPL